MAKKISKVPLSPAEEAAKKAETIVLLRESIKAQTEECAVLLEELTTYCDDNGIKSGDEIGPLQAVRKANPVKLVGDGLTKKEEDYAKEQLINELPEFTKKSLDLSKLYAALRTNSIVANALDAKGLGLLQESTWMFKGL